MVKIPEKIPDAWIGGYLRTHPGASVRDAVMHWLNQARMAEGGPVTPWGKKVVRRMKGNPTLAILNPGGRAARYPGGDPKLLQSDRVYEIRYRHADDKQDYKHEFAPGVVMYALESGAILLQRLDGQPLWKDFD